MKKCLLFVALFGGIAISCKKNSSGSSGSYHLTATVDGKAKTFNVSPVGTRVAVNGTTYYSIGGLATSSATGETMEIGFNSQPGGPVFKVGSYTDTSSVYDIEGIYQLSLTQMYTAG